MQFRKYQHVERFGEPEVQGIEKGVVRVFDKIDGSCAQVYLGDDGKVKAGSRNRELTLENDNHGFYAYILDNSKFEKFLKEYPNYRLYGEWLDKHTVKDYVDDAWNKFYVFDVVEERQEILNSTDIGETAFNLTTTKFRYLSYDEYEPLLEKFDIECIPPIMTIINGDREDFEGLLDKVTYKMKDGCRGEGIVCKRYDFYNQYGRQVWAKIVRDEFKQHKQHKVKQNVENKECIEYQIVQKYCTDAFIEKEYLKVVDSVYGQWESKCIPMLLNNIYHTFINEETWNILKRYKNPTINFRVLKSKIDERVKEVKSDLF